MFVDAGDLEEVIDTLAEFIIDLYDYLGIELPEDFDPEVEILNVVAAIKGHRDGLIQ